MTVAATEALQRASARLLAGDVFEAERLCRELLAADGAHFEALRLLALSVARRAW